mmetsp:Transcript_38091/g.99664  ORF Transcript_38091/g.99664 Transcript_38091/m.99664 type:complete len:226 (+) Transcript_38091:3179-3856(+)
MLCSHGVCLPVHGEVTAARTAGPRTRNGSAGRRIKCLQKFVGGGALTRKNELPSKRAPWLLLATSDSSLVCATCAARPKGGHNPRWGRLRTSAHLPVSMPSSSMLRKSTILQCWFGIRALSSPLWNSEVRKMQTSREYGFHSNQGPGRRSQTSMADRSLEGHASSESETSMSSTQGSTSVVASLSASTCVSSRSPRQPDIDCNTGSADTPSQSLRRLLCDEHDRG